MQRTITSKMSAAAEAHLKTAIKECDAAMVRVFKRIKRDQEAIDKLKKETRAMLNAMKAA